MVNPYFADRVAWNFTSTVIGYDLCNECFPPWQMAMSCENWSIPLWVCDTMVDILILAISGTRTSESASALACSLCGFLGLVFQSYIEYSKVTFCQGLGSTDEVQ